MTAIVYTRNYVTQDELSRAYRRLDHTPPPAPNWSATLLVDPSLELSWAVPVLNPPEDREEHPASHTWHVIARAGGLDWPPLRPEEEIWPELLKLQPVPTDEMHERRAQGYGMTVEEKHREDLRLRFLSRAHIAGVKRNASEVCFDPVVRDWDVTARAFAEFLDTHRPPRLTAEHRVMAQGVHLAKLEAEIATTKASLGHLMRNAAREQGEKLRHGFKSDMARWGGVSRPTADAWLGGGGCCEGAVPGEDATAHTHADEGEDW